MRVYTSLRFTESKKGGEVLNDPARYSLQETELHSIFEFDIGEPPTSKGTKQETPSSTKEPTEPIDADEEQRLSNNQLEEQDNNKVSPRYPLRERRAPSCLIRELEQYDSSSLALRIDYSSNEDIPVPTTYKEATTRQQSRE